jgi:hypothetical protein
MHTPQPTPSHWPANARQALDTLAASLAASATCPAALVVFGSLVTGGWREGQSNINVALVLDDASPAVLEALGPIFRRARADSNLSPLVLELRELPRVADVFPLKFAHIKAHHHVLIGTDPFAALSIDLAALRLRAEAELRNQWIRMRQAWLLHAEDPIGAARIVQSAVKPLAVELEALLLVQGRAVAFEAGAATVLRTAPTVFPQLDRAFFDTLSNIAEGGRVEGATALLARLLDQLGQTVASAGGPA